MGDVSDVFARYFHFTSELQFERSLVYLYVCIEPAGNVFSAVEIPLITLGKMLIPLLVVRLHGAGDRSCLQIGDAQRAHRSAGDLGGHRTADPGEGVDYRRG